MQQQQKQAKEGSNIRGGGGRGGKEDEWRERKLKTNENKWDRETSQKKKNIISEKNQKEIVENDKEWNEKKKKIRRKGQKI